MILLIWILSFYRDEKKEKKKKKEKRKNGENLKEEDGKKMLSHIYFAVLFFL